jgi:hypothetical protein
MTEALGTFTVCTTLTFTEFQNILGSTGRNHVPIKLETITFPTPSQPNLPTQYMLTQSGYFR